MGASCHLTLQIKLSKKSLEYFGLSLDIFWRYLGLECIIFMYHYRACYLYFAMPPHFNNCCFLELRYIALKRCWFQKRNVQNLGLAVSAVALIEPCHLGYCNIALPCQLNLEPNVRRLSTQSNDNLWLPWNAWRKVNAVADGYTWS